MVWSGNTYLTTRSTVGMTVALNNVFMHDDVIKWKYFGVTGPLWGKPPVTGVFPSQRSVTRSFDVRPNKRLSKQSRRRRQRWFETPSRSLWRHWTDPVGSCAFYIKNYRSLSYTYRIQYRTNAVHWTLAGWLVTRIVAWISNHMHYLIRYGITFLCHNFN